MKSGEAFVVHTAWKCNGAAPVLLVDADHGSVRIERSVRFVCGKEDHPVSQVVYVSPPNFEGSDAVRVYDTRNRPRHVVRVSVGASISNAYKAEEEIVRKSIGRDGEVSVYIVWNCAGNIALPLVRAAKGFITFKDIRMTACGRTDQPAKSVVYRPPVRFSGVDEAMIKTAFAPPVKAIITVSEKLLLSPSMWEQLDGYLQETYKKCWAYEGGLEVPSYIPMLEVVYSTEGELVKPPRLLNAPIDAGQRLLAESAVAAIQKCNPIRIPERFRGYHSEWGKRVLRFDPEALPAVQGKNADAKQKGSPKYRKDKIQELLAAAKKQKGSLKHQEDPLQRRFNPAALSPLLPGDIGKGWSDPAASK